METKERLEVANAIKEVKTRLNKIIVESSDFRARFELMDMHAKLDELEMFVRSLVGQYDGKEL